MAIPETMQAVRYTTMGPPNVLHLETIPTPKPAENEVLIRIDFAGINPVDAHLRSSDHPNLRVPLPATPGKDASGHIAAVGSSVKLHKVGDRVFVSHHQFRSNGTYAEYHVANEEEVHSLPVNYTMEEGAAAGASYFTAIRAIFHAAKGKSGETLFIHGASGQVGLACVQIGVAHGFIVYGTAGTEEGLKRVLDNGAKAVFNHREEKYTEKIKEALGPKGANIIIEMSPPNNLQKDLELIGRRGRIVIVGGCKVMPNFNPTMIMAKELIVTGVKLADSLPNEWKEMTAVLREGLVKCWIRPVIGKKYSLAEAVQAHCDLESPSGSQGKLLMKISG